MHISYQPKFILFKIFKICSKKDGGVRNAHDPHHWLLFLSHPIACTSERGIWNFSVVFESQIPNSTLRRIVFAINSTTFFQQFLLFCEWRSKIEYLFDCFCICVFAYFHKVMRYKLAHLTYSFIKWPHWVSIINLVHWILQGKALDFPALCLHYHPEQMLCKT